jgi:hypothetical protein
MLKVINFLPGDYLERLKRRRANFACLIIGWASVLLMGSVIGVIFVSMIGLSAMRTQVDQQYQQASQQISQLEQLEERKTGLLHKVELSADLLERVPRSHLLARVANYLPEKTTLMGLVMRLEDVEVPIGSAAASADAADKKAAGGASSGQPAPADKRSGKRGKADTVKVKQWVFRVDGMAPTDVAVAEFIGRIGSDPLFCDVDLQFSEEFPYKESLPMRKFQVCFRLSPDAEKVIGTGSAPAATVASPAPAATKGDS